MLKSLVSIFSEVLILENKFQFVPSDPQLVFRRNCNPIDVIGQHQRSVRFDCNEIYSRVQCVDERVVDLQSRLAARKHDELTRPSVDLLNDLAQRPLLKILVLSVAIIAVQIAAREPNEYRSASRPVSLALYRIKNFIYSITHRRPGCFSFLRSRCDNRTESFCRAIPQCSRQSD